MNISAVDVRFDEDRMWVSLSDGRDLGIPLVWFPRLLHATPVDRASVEITPFGLHWPALDEDISVAGLLAGRGDVAAVGEGGVRGCTRRFGKVDNPQEAFISALKMDG